MADLEDKAQVLPNSFQATWGTFQTHSKHSFTRPVGPGRPLWNRLEPRSGLLYLAAHQVAGHREPLRIAGEKCRGRTSHAVQLG